MYFRLLLFLTTCTCMYPFPIDRYLGCLQSLPSKVMLPWASSRLSPYGLCTKGGDAEPEGMYTLSIPQLVLQILHQLALPQPCLTGSHLPHPCQPLILSDFLILAKHLGKKMTSDNFAYSRLLLKSPHAHRAIPDLKSKGQAKESVHPRTRKNPRQICSSSPRDFTLHHVISWTSAYLLLPTALGSTHSTGAKGDCERLMPDSWVVWLVFTRTSVPTPHRGWSYWLWCTTRRDGLFSYARGSGVCERAGDFFLLFYFFNQFYWGIMHIR